MLRASVAVLLALAALPAAGRGEICRFRAAEAENPFRRWLVSQEVTCVAAGERVAFPEGLWNVFARADGEISAMPLLIEGGAAPATVAPELVPAATVTTLLPEKHAGVLYATRRGSAFPVEGSRATVPADEPLWLFVLDQKSKPVAVITVAPLAAGSAHEVDARGSGPAAAIGWLQVPEIDRMAIAKASAVLTPTLRAGSREADLLPAPTRLNGAFFRIRDVPPGHAELKLEGKGWVSDRRVVKVQPGITVAAVPLTVRATGTIVVYWSSDDADLPALDYSVESCDEPSPFRMLIALFRCPGPRRGRFEADDCTSVREADVRGPFGSVAFEELLPGTYRAELRYGKLTPSIATGSVGPLRVVDLRILASYFTARGTITRGGEPLGEQARIEFPDGIGSVRRRSTEYRAVLRPPPFDVDAQINVEACDGSPSAIVLADEPMRPHVRFNIDIPVNELRIHVNDTFTREPLQHATVKLEAMSLRGPRVVFSTTADTDERGNVVWTSVPTRELHLTVTHGGYEPRVVEPFSMPRSGERQVEVQLVPLRGTRGKIVSERAFEKASVVWFAPDGRETERSELAPDGTFVWLNRHTADATMGVVSASHPLWVLHASATASATEDRDSISIPFPNAPAIAFDVWLDTPVPADETRHIGVTIGAIRVPQPLLEQHQMLRRDPPLLRGSGPQHFRDLLATGAIDVLLGPRADEVPARARRFDLFALPQFANPERERLDPSAPDVVFALDDENQLGLPQK